MSTIYVKGDRVKLSQLAIRCHVGYTKPTRIGTVMTTGRTGIGVCWDGNSPRSISVYHPDYLEAVELRPTVPQL